MTARDRLADAYEEQAAVLTRLAEVTAQVAHELRGIEPDAARASVAAVVPDGAPAAAAGVPAPAAAPSAALGICPVHRVGWTVKDGGISKTGKPYPAFWRCALKDDDAWCDKKPIKAWVDSHPIALEPVA